MGTSKNLTTTFCFIRSTEFGRIGKHRFGAIAFAPVTDAPDKARVAWSLCSVKDTFSAIEAKSKAIGRLNSENTSVIVDRNSNAVIMESGILNGLKLARAGTSERFDFESSIRGALHDLAISNARVSAAKG